MKVVVFRIKVDFEIRIAVEWGLYWAHVGLPFC